MTILGLQTIKMAGLQYKGPFGLQTLHHLQDNQGITYSTLQSLAFSKAIFGGSLQQCLAHFRRSNSQIGNWDQQQGSNGQRSPSIGRRSESEWSDHRRASLQHQDSLESRRSEAEASPKNVAAANKVAADNSEDELLQIKRRQWEESTAKRIHVVVRARPLNIREIKNDARVYHLFTS